MTQCARRCIAEAPALAVSVIDMQCNATHECRDLGLEVKPEKVSLSQNLILSKTNIRGKACLSSRNHAFVCLRHTHLRCMCAADVDAKDKQKCDTSCHAFVQVSIVARQHLASMIANPRPTRAEMTDVANAVFDSADALTLGDETAAGAYPVQVVSTMAKIIANAEEATNYYATTSFIADFTAKPFDSMEAACSCLARASVDTDVAAVVTVTKTGVPAQTACKFRPAVPQLVISASQQVAAAQNLYFGCIGVHWAELEGGSPSVADALDFVRKAASQHGVQAGQHIAVLHGAGAPEADQVGVLSIVHV